MIIDLHADILAYLAEDPAHSPYDSAVRASVDDLQKAGVGLQVLPIFCPTLKHATEFGQKQANIYKSLSTTYPEAFGQNKIQILPSIENLSSFFEEDEPLEYGFERLTAFGEPFTYISFTWNQENRFGGGSEAPNAGLKEDGKHVLDFCKMHPITHAIDISHASDKLAEDILNYLSSTKNSLKVIASHSNFRAICHVPRNLPDSLADEVVRRGGIIGINCIKPFLGDTLSHYFAHIEYGLTRGYQKHLALGCDFFADSTLQRFNRHKNIAYFFDKLSSAASLTWLQNELRVRFGKDVADDITHQNVRTCLIETPCYIQTFSM